MPERISKLAGGAPLILALSLGLGSAGVAEEASNDFAYQLQRSNLETLGKTEFDLVIMDYSRDGSDEERFTAEEIGDLNEEIGAPKDSPGGPKTVFSYMSIGEAEDYRWYWQQSWDRDRDGRPDAGAPAWLGRSNPGWPGNDKVSLLGPGLASASLRLRGQGPRGRPRRRLPWHRGRLRVLGAHDTPGVPIEDEMVDLVKSISTYARVTHNHPDFQVFVQNAEELSRRCPPTTCRP